MGIWQAAMGTCRDPNMPRTAITSDLKAARDGAMTFSFMFNYTFKLNMGFFHSTKDSESPNQGLNLKHEVRSTQLFCRTAH